MSDIETKIEKPSISDDSISTVEIPNNNESTDKPIEKSHKSYTQHFRNEWLRDVRFENWLMPVEGDSLKCICKFCKSVLWAKLSDIDRHRKTRKHQTRTGVFFPDQPNRPMKGIIDEEKLITLVRDNPELYDGKHHDKEYIADLWKKIGEVLDVKDVEARKKWCILRSNYIQEKRKLTALENSAQPYHTSALFDLLRFLDSHLKQTSKPSLSTTKQLILDQVTKEELAGTSFEVVYSNEETDNNTNASNVSTVLEVNRPNKSKGATARILRMLHQISENTTIDSDSDFLFLRSLLPMIKKLGTVENLEFREEIIQVLKKKLQQQSNTICLTPSSNSVSICYGDQRTNATTSQNHIDNTPETIIIYPQAHVGSTVP